MPTFGFDEADADVLQENDSYFRHFLAGSMQFLRLKKFSKARIAEEERVRREVEEAAQARREALRRFEEQREKHYATFKSTRKKNEPLKEVQCPDATIRDLSQMWLEEYNHPSCTANISVHEVFQPEGDLNTSQISVISHLDYSQDSVFNNSALNSSSQAIFSTSVLVGGSMDPSASSGDKPLFGKLNTDKLEMFSGARPSFGGAFASTPISKALKEPIPALQPIQETPILESTSVQESGKSEQEQKKEKLLTLLRRRSSVTKPTDPLTIVVHYMRDVDRKDYNDMAKERFEKSGNPLRAVIKRTLNEKISLSAKRMATKEEIYPVIIFLKQLVGGKPVEGHNRERIQVKDRDTLAYVYDIMINVIMGILERDITLLGVLLVVIAGVCGKDRNFQSVLVGHLFSVSLLLRLDPDACKTFVDTMTANPQKRQFMVDREKTAMKLFLAMHTPKHKRRLTMGNLWRILAITMNAPPRPLATTLILITLLETCTKKLQKTYGRQWKKLKTLLLNEFLPGLEAHVDKCPLSQLAGESAYLSLLRDLAENL